MTQTLPNVSNIEESSVAAANRSAMCGVIRQYQSAIVAKTGSHQPAAWRHQWRRRRKAWRISSESNDGSNETAAKNQAAVIWRKYGVKRKSVKHEEAAASKRNVSSKRKRHLRKRRSSKQRKAVASAKKWRRSESGGGNGSNISRNQQ